MNTEDYINFLEKEIHTTIIATVDEKGLPVTCAIDIMHSDEKGLYFLTAKGKGFYHRLIKEKFIALTGIKGEDTMHCVAVSIRGKVEELGGELLPFLFSKNEYMNEIYPTEKSREALTVFRLYDTFGFPPEITEELAKEQGFKINMQEFEELFKMHQEKSRLGSEQKFKGGLAEQNEITTAYHTATHLLHEALREVLGEHVKQNGSNITSERLRFDFTHPQKMTKEEIQKVEDLVNEQIQKDLAVTCEEMSYEDAKKSGAIGLFTDKYGDKVKVYAIGDFSKEICGGPHVSHTGELGKFKIKKEESSSSGVRRIKAILIQE